jgi:hypothetical protein
MNIGVHNYGALVLWYLATNAWLSINVATSFDNMLFVLEVDTFACNIINGSIIWNFHDFRKTCLSPLNFTKSLKG